MAEGRVQRKLTTILAADVEGYSRLMYADEEATLKTLKSYREIIDSLIAKHDGRLVGTAGDAVLVEFGSAVEAVRCAMSVQEDLAVCNEELSEDRRMRFRIGINVGDVMVEGDDLFGDGVNVAARLEGLCDPGEVYVSRSVYDQVVGKLDASFDDLGERTVKNIARPVRVYWARSGNEATTWALDAPDTLPLPTKPSIAFLPFKNLSDDPSQDYLADGIRLAIQSTLIHVPGLFLIGQGAVGRYRGNEVATQHVARELGVRYILQGTFQQVGGDSR